MQGTPFVKLSLCVFLFAVLTSSSSGQRRRGYPTPPAPATPDGLAIPEANAHRRRLDTVTMEREAKEMAALVSSISDDIEQLKKGLLPIASLDKLKRIEKLSKQLRGQIQP